MSRRLQALLLASLACLSLAPVGCRHPPGKPGPGPEVIRPDHVLDFATLYKQDCIACHGDSQHPGAAIFLANPVYLAVAGEANIVDVLNHGRPGKLMPAFGKVGGGLLSEEQVDVLAKGLIATWGKPGVLDSLHPPGFNATLTPDPAAGQKVFATHCARCHGDNGEGADVKGALVDPAFLGLVSDQNLRSIVIAGMNPEMPNFHEQESNPPLTDQNVTDVVAWLGSHRARGVAADGPSSPAKSMTASAAPTAKREPSSKQEPNP
jgi:mono/diheme cytochrome c family protein